MRRLTMLVAIVCFLAGTAALAGDGPVVFFYEAEGRVLLSVQVRPAAEPVSLVFSVEETLPAKLAMEFGQSLFLGTPAETAAKLKTFQSELAEKTGETSTSSVFLTTEDISRLRAVAVKTKVGQAIADVRLVNLNAALNETGQVEQLQAFLALTNLSKTRVGAPPLEKVEQCRPVIERNLRELVAARDTALLAGAIRNVHSMADCLDAHDDDDRDGIRDVDEVQLFGTDPSNRDSDRDTLADADEIALRAEFPGLDPTRADTDGDGLSDGEEMTLREQGTLVDPCRADTDGDGVNDENEIGALFDGKRFDPTDPHTFSPKETDGEIFSSLSGRRRGFGVGAMVLAGALVLLCAATVLLVHYWRLDKSERLKRERLKSSVDVDNFTFAPDEPFARHAPGLGKPAAPPAPGPVAAKSTIPPSLKSLLDEEWEGVAVELIEEDDDMPDPEARKAVSDLKDQLSQLQGQVSQFSAAMTRFAERFDKVFPAVDTRLKALEVAVTRLTQNAGAVQDRGILKKFNQQELLISQSMNEMGRMLDDTAQRIERLETQVKMLLQ